MKAITRREWLLTALGTGATAAALGASARVWGQENRAHPNIIFILADDLGYGDLGCYGQERIRTPFLDSMAAEGMRFTNAYAGSTVCAPSRCTLMTGRHTGHCTVRGNALVPLLPEDVTVAEVLRNAGYATGLVGKWGMGEPESTGLPTRQGFDYFFGYLNQGHAHNYYPDFLWRGEERVPIEQNVQRERGVAAACVQYSHDLFMDEAERFVREHKEGPFFLYLALTIPHANNERGLADGNGMEVPSDAPYSDESWPQPQKNHAAMITRMDQGVGRILGLLRELGIHENTLVVFSSDNGPHKEGGAVPGYFRSAGALRGIKRDLYEGGIRVPMLAWWPGVIAAGCVSDHVLAFWDILPTAAELAGVPAPEGLDGISAAPTLLGKPDVQRRHEYLYWEFHEGGFKQAVRLDHWKAVRPGTEAPIEVYDLSNDISEQRDLAAEQTGIVAQAAALFTSARTESEHWPIRGKGADRARPKT